MGLCNLLRSFDIAEASAFDLNLTIAFLGRIDNLLADVFSLAITIGPDDEQARVPCLLRQILGNILLVLEKVRVYMSSRA